ncbi:MAG: hypothetical protein ACQEWV_29375 [Bacillota bacterium]
MYLDNNGFRITGMFSNRQESPFMMTVFLDIKSDINTLRVDPTVG